MVFAVCGVWCIPKLKQLKEKKKDEKRIDRVCECCCKRVPESESDSDSAESAVPRRAVTRTNLRHDSEDSEQQHWQHWQHENERTPLLSLASPDSTRSPQVAVSKPELVEFFMRSCVTFHWHSFRQFKCQ